jgi:hypothetical protein
MRNIARREPGLVVAATPDLLPADGATATMATMDHNILAVDVAASIIVTGLAAPVARFVVPNKLAVRADEILAAGKAATAVVEDGRNVVDIKETAT